MAKKKMNPLNKAIMEGKTLPIKGRKKLPPDYDVILPGMGYTKPTKKNPPRKIKPAPLAKAPKNMKPGMKSKSSGKGKR
jgi:hypothetical protein